MYSEKEIDASDFEHKKLNIAQTDFDKLKQNWIGFIRNGKLELEKSHSVIKQEKLESIENIKTKLLAVSDKNTRDVLDEILKLTST